MENVNVKKQNGGFTLIELLVVVLIIGILAAVAVPQYQVAVGKAKATQALIFADAVAKAQHIFRMANGTYTDNFEELDIEFPGTLSPNKKTVSTDTYTLTLSLNPSYNEPYMQIVPSNSSISVLYYIHKRKECRAKTSSNGLGDKICIALGGIYNDHLSRSEVSAGAYKVYILP